MAAAGGGAATEPALAMASPRARPRRAWCRLPAAGSVRRAARLAQRHADAAGKEQLEAADGHRPRQCVRHGAGRRSASGSPPCSGVAMARSASPSHCSSASAGEHRAGPLRDARAQLVAYGGPEWQAGMGEAVEADGQHGEPRLGAGRARAGAGGRCRAQPACRREKGGVPAGLGRPGAIPEGTAGKAMADKVVERPRLETWRNPDGGGDTGCAGSCTAGSRHAALPPGAAGARGAPALRSYGTGAISPRGLARMAEAE